MEGYALALLYLMNKKGWFWLLVLGTG
jgi:hypothetical protein